MKRWDTFDDAWRDFAQNGLGDGSGEALTPAFEEFCRGVFYAGAVAWSRLFAETYCNPNNGPALRSLFDELEQEVAARHRQHTTQ